jgi:hypothetical protein
MRRRKCSGERGREGAERRKGRGVEGGRSGREGGRSGKEGGRSGKEDSDEGERRGEKGDGKRVGML